MHMFLELPLLLNVIEELMIYIYIYMYVLPYFSFSFLVALIKQRENKQREL